MGKIHFQAIKCSSVLYKVSLGNKNGQSHLCTRRAHTQSTASSAGEKNEPPRSRYTQSWHLAITHFNQNLLFKLKHESTVRPPTHLLSSHESQQICSDVTNTPLGYVSYPVVKKKKRERKNEDLCKVKPGRGGNGIYLAVFSERIFDKTAPRCN